MQATTTERDQATTVIFVPREGFLDVLARAILGLSPEQFATLQGELVFGEWTLVRHREHIMLPGMVKLAGLCGSELRFEREPEAQDAATAIAAWENWLMAWERENER